MRKKSENNISNQEILELSQDILEALHTFSGHTEKRFDHLEKDVHQLKNDVQELKSDVGQLKGDVIRLKNTAVTKDYLDEKLMDLKGDLIVMMRKEDNKLVALVKVLENKKVISKKESR